MFANSSLLIIIVNCKLDGPAEILAVDNGDLSRHFIFKSEAVQANSGQCQLIIKATGKKGVISVHAEAAGLKRNTLQIRVE